MTIAAWLHDIDPFVFRITDDFGPRWYGMAYIAGFLGAWWLIRALARRGRSPLAPAHAFDLIFVIAVGVLVGGRLGYVLVYQPALLTDFSTMAPWWGALRINEGGMASHGGVVGVVLACLWYGRRHGVTPLHLLDLTVLTAPVGLLCGRVANFINGELLGRIVAPPGEPAPWWSVRFPQEILTEHDPERTPEQTVELIRLLESRHVTGDGDDLAPAATRVIDEIQRGDRTLAEQIEPLLSARMPSQLLQALAEGVILFIVLWLIWAKPRKPGVVGAWFLIVYGVLRIVTEVWRLPDDHLANPTPLGLSRGQWLSAVMVLAGLITLRWVSARNADRIGGWRAPSPSNPAPSDAASGD